MNLRNVSLLQRGYTVLYPTELSSSALLVVFCGCKMRCYFERRTYNKNNDGLKKDKVSGQFEIGVAYCVRR
jgi:hypothetical protein